MLFQTYLVSLAIFESYRLYACSHIVQYTTIDCVLANLFMLVSSINMEGDEEVVYDWATQIRKIKIGIKLEKAS